MADLDRADIPNAWPKVLSRAGYKTAFIASSYAFGTRYPNSVDVARLFDRVFLSEDLTRSSRPLDETIELFEKVAGEHSGERLALVTHVFDPHSPYWMSSYGENVTRVDSGVARILTILDRLGLYDRSHVILTSDHGESLLQHNAPAGHGWNIYDEQTGIPLIWKRPFQQRPSTSDAVVANYEIGPTLIHLVAGEVPRAPGAALIPAMTGIADEREKFMFHMTLPNRVWPAGQVGIRDSEHFLVRSAVGPSPVEVYRYRSDPRELYDISRSREGRTAIRKLLPHLNDAVGRWTNRSTSIPEVSRDAQATLRSLGYLGTGASYDTSAVTSEEVAPGLTARFRGVITERWSLEAAETRDGIYPRRLLVMPSGRMFVAENATNDLRRIYERSSREPIDGSSSDPHFQFITHAVTTEDESVVALVNGRQIVRFFASTSGEQHFREEIAMLPRDFQDIEYVQGHGYILFDQNGIFIREEGSKQRLLAPLVSDSARLSWSPSRNTFFVGEGSIVWAVRPGQKPALFHDFGAAVLSVNVHSGQVWVGVGEALPRITEDTRYPISIFDSATGEKLGHFGRRFSDVTNNWGAPLRDVGPLGIQMPSQIVVSGDAVWVLDSYLERIMTYDLDDRRR